MVCFQSEEEFEANPRPIICIVESIVTVLPPLSVSASGCPKMMLLSVQVFLDLILFSWQPNSSEVIAALKQGDKKLSEGDITLLGEFHHAPPPLPQIADVAWNSSAMYINRIGKFYYMLTPRSLLDLSRVCVLCVMKGIYVLWGCVCLFI